MVTIPHSWATLPVAPLLSLVLALAGALSCRTGRVGWVPVVAAVAALAGWAVLLPMTRIEGALLAPRLGGSGILLTPAVVGALGAAVIAWRGGRPSRWVAVAVAGFAGWWVARAAVGPSDFWRVLFGIAGLTWVVSRFVAGQVSRGLACALALWGGLTIAGSGLAGTALVAVAVWAGLLAGPGGVLPAVLMAALIGVADVGGGRLVRGKFDAVDLACGLALVAPVVAGLIEGRLGKRFGGYGALVAALLAAAGVAAGDWLLRRALFT